MSPRVKDILSAVAAMHGFSLDDLCGPARPKKLALARFDAIRRIRALRNQHGQAAFSYPAIGKIFNRDHTTVLAGHQRALEVFGPADSAWPPTSCFDVEETRL